VSIGGTDVVAVALVIWAAVGRTTTGSFHPVGTVIGIVNVAVSVFEVIYSRRRASVADAFLC
jgi:hypothetical protein